MSTDGLLVVVVVMMMVKTEAVAMMVTVSRFKSVTMMTWTTELVLMGATVRWILPIMAKWESVAAIGRPLELVECIRCLITVL